MISSVLSSLLAFLDSSVCTNSKFFLGFAWSASCEKEYLNKLPRFFAGSWLSPLADLVGSPTDVRFHLFVFWSECFFPPFSQNSCHLTWDWECDPEFEGKLHAYSQYSPRSIKLGWLSGELSWGRHWGGSLRAFEGWNWPDLPWR